ncbi:hypothetical protein C8J57DRAFT_1235477 [Mycena rebaudengoi]|nr:hypothetical protein C8J57DRAFT_1235477 [Mycena rebaudengoi]
MSAQSPPQKPLLLPGIAPHLFESRPAHRKKMRPKNSIEVSEEMVRQRQAVVTQAENLQLVRHNQAQAEKIRRYRDELQCSERVMGPAPVLNEQRVVHVRTQKSDAVRHGRLPYADSKPARPTPGREKKIKKTERPRRVGRAPAGTKFEGPVERSSRRTTLAGDGTDGRVREEKYKDPGCRRTYQRVARPVIGRGRDVLLSRVYLRNQRKTPEQAKSPELNMFLATTLILNIPGGKVKAYSDPIQIKTAAQPSAQR